MHFGSGLVPSSDDFGKIRAHLTPSTILKLCRLDWDWNFLVVSGWDIKAMNQLIVNVAHDAHSRTRSACYVGPERERKGEFNGGKYRCWQGTSFRMTGRR